MAYHFAISPIEKQILVRINQKDSVLQWSFGKIQNLIRSENGEWRMERIEIEVKLEELR